MEKSKVITELEARIKQLEDKKPEEKGSKEEDGCPTCGGKLAYVDEGIRVCTKCGEYWEIEEDE